MHVDRSTLERRLFRFKSVIEEKLSADTELADMPKKIYLQTPAAVDS